ncbi:MAG: potassium-transporting ATPase subunit KdpA [Myxococcaceae bacterium]|nr:potassium-transporting ATPase subunit KdpA [Myxococcaceae bacterium]
MSTSVISLLVFMAVLTALAAPLGRFIARVLDGPLPPTLDKLEAGLMNVAGVDRSASMSWQRYAASVLVFNALGLFVVYLVLRLQHLLPFNPAGVGAVTPEVAMNTAISFATNTNWQAYSGETTLSHLSQFFALTVQNFVSAATGIAVLLAVVRGLRDAKVQGVGNFWVDLVRSTLLVLLPLSAVLALALVSQGVVQTFDAPVTASLLEPQTLADGTVVSTQTLAVGPVASQVAIKQLGTNGGGYFNVNSAHPFENPTPLSNALEVLAILLIPAALCFALGRMVKDARQGWALYGAMALLFVPLTAVTMWAEHQGTPVLSQLGVDLGASELQPGGNMEGKEMRFGITHSALWAAVTTAASNGSVNSMHDSFTPLGGLIPMWLMQLGEVVFGGVGSGLYGMLVFALFAVFIAGLMVGRTPEYLGKKVEAFEVKMASLVILFPSASVLVGTAIACALPQGTSVLGNPGAHGFSEILYAFSSGANNNGSAFGGLTASGPFYAYGIGLAMLIGRYWIIVPVLAIAGSLAKKGVVPPSSGTLPTHGPLFIVLLALVVVLVGALTFLPALALGPIVEHLSP